MFIPAWVLILLVVVVVGMCAAAYQNGVRDGRSDSCDNCHEYHDDNHVASNATPRMEPERFTRRLMREMAIEDNATHPGIYSRIFGGKRSRPRPGGPK